MEESVALDSSKQKKFVKSVKGIKKLLKKNDKKPVKIEVTKETSDEVSKDGKVKKRKSRGLVYLSHIPHGFYEHQMTEYFKQFGVVTNARVIRSKRTGNSKGFAFVEFREPAVAEIVAETMNNYLMGKRLIKATYIPPNKQKRHALRKKWNTLKNPARDNRLMYKKLHNADKNEAEEIQKAQTLLSNLSKTKKKLSVLGIDYDFFKPVDVPEALIEKVENVISQTDAKPKIIKNESKEFKSEDTLKTIKSEAGNVNVDVKINKKKKKLKQKPMNNDKFNSNENFESGKVKPSGENTQNKVENNKSNKAKQIKQQNNKEEKLKKPENFISLKESEESDSSIDFDSDEFEKMIEKESNDDLSSGDESSGLENEDIQDLPKIDHIRNTKSSQNQGKAKTDLRDLKKQDKADFKLEKVVKRKNTQIAPVTTKKAKFEKQMSKRPLKKVINKRK